MADYRLFAVDFDFARFHLCASQHSVFSDAVPRHPGRDLRFDKVIQTSRPCALQKLSQEAAVAALSDREACYFLPLDAHAQEANWAFVCDLLLNAVSEMFRLTNKVKAANPCFLARCVGYGAKESMDLMLFKPPAGPFQFESLDSFSERVRAMRAAFNMYNELTFEIGCSYAVQQRQHFQTLRIVVFLLTPPRGIAESAAAKQRVQAYIAMINMKGKTDMVAASSFELFNKQLAAVLTACAVVRVCFIAFGTGSGSTYIKAAASMSAQTQTLKSTSFFRLSFEAQNFLYFDALASQIAASKESSARGALEARSSEYQALVDAIRCHFERREAQNRSQVTALAQRDYLNRIAEAVEPAHDSGAGGHINQADGLINSVNQASYANQASAAAQNVEFNNLTNYDDEFVPQPQILYPPASLSERGAASEMAFNERRISQLKQKLAAERRLVVGSGGTAPLLKERAAVKISKESKEALFGLNLVEKQLNQVKQQFRGAFDEFSTAAGTRRVYVHESVPLAQYASAELATLLFKQGYTKMRLKGRLAGISAARRAGAYVGVLTACGTLIMAADAYDALLQTGE